MTSTGYVMMGLLSEGPLTGYMIKKLIDVRFRFFWSESYGQIYPVLQQLVKQGWVNSGPGERKSSKVYTLTEEGQKALSEWLMLAPVKATYRLEILIKVYFAHLAPTSSLKDHLHTHLQEHTQELGLLNAFKHELESIPDPQGDHRNILSVIDYGIRYNQAILDWSNATLSRLEDSNESNVA